jgi:predicted nucleotidyltransferase
VNEAAHVQPSDPREWIGRLPSHVARQANVLERLLDFAEDDQRVRAVRMRGSIARSTADEFSDLDTRMWISDGAYEATLADLAAVVRSFAPTLDVLFETPGSPYLFVQYANGVQLELSTAQASDPSGRDRGVVVLLDRDGLWDQPYEESPPGWDEKLWLGWGWMALADVDKYLRRGSLWEALTALEKARSLLLRHHAAETGMRDPAYGLTSILDYGGYLPPRLETTVAGLEAAGIRRAAQACAELFTAYGRPPFADYVLARLSSVD